MTLPTHKALSSMPRREILSRVHELDESNTSLIFDVHKYLDADESKTHADCRSSHVEDTLIPLTVYLEVNGKVAILSETSSRNTSSMNLNSKDSSIALC